MSSLKSSPSLSRKELQSYLKRNGIRAVGSTEALQAAYQAHQSGWTTSEVNSSMVAHSVASATSPQSNNNNNNNDKKKTPTPAKQKEKRLAKYRSTCSQKTRARIDRAKTQRMYLVSRGDVSPDSLECKFVVLGSTGNVYTVKICKKSSCSCPDFQKGNLCKHVLFVLLKVIGIDSNSPLVYQAALLESELQELFDCMERRAQRVGGGGISDDVLANEQVRTTYAAGLKGSVDIEASLDNGTKRKSVDQDADCPICFDSLQSGTLTFCRGTCGTNFHQDCIQRWLGQQRGQHTCPNCRQPWQTTDAASTSTLSEGYTNLGQLQGLSPERDTSTYSQWSPPYSSGYKRRRYW